MSAEDLAETESPAAASIETVRLFFAVEVPEGPRAEIEAIAGRMQKAAQFAGSNPRWVPPEHFHVTLLFLGNVPVPAASELSDGMARLVEGIAGFDMDVRHVGCFPDIRAPRVVWIGVHQPPPALGELRDRCVSLARKVGVAPEKQEFTPHVTLARLKGSRGVHNFVTALEQFRFAKAGKGPVTRLVLMRSVPGTGGSTYTPHAVAPLG